MSYADVRDDGANDVVYDVVIVGSGAGGGMAAYQLTKAGLKCVVLEAGDWYDTAKDSKWLQWGYDAAHRGAPREAMGAGGFDAVVGGWKVEGEPYTCAAGTDFKWYRSRMLGGRTNAWGRIALRNGPYDFKPHSRDGKGFDWPIGYEDLAPYYDRTEELIGVFGTAEGMENLPDGRYQPPPAPRCYERLVQKACGTLGIACIPSRLAILTQPKGERPACHYVAQCGRGCRMGSNFSSPAVLLYPALETGNLEIRCNAMVREVMTGKDGLATGVAYVDKKTGETVEVRGRVVVLAASACETARLLLNSRGAVDGAANAKGLTKPKGLANSSGMVGKYLMDTVMSDVTGWVPAMMDLPAHNEDGVGGMHLYMPWTKYKEQARGELAFSRGYHIEFGGGRRGMPGPGLLSGAEGLLGGGYGATLKEKSRRLYGSFVSFHGRGEMIPNEQSYCEIDEKAVDRWGIPVLKFHFAWGEEERQMARHMQETSQAIVKAMGGTVIESYGAAEGWGIAAGGEAIHEVGGARMGSDAKTSVVNARCQAWDCGNLFVADGSPFVSLAEKNPTLTILALAWRTSEYIAAQMTRRSS